MASMKIGVLGCFYGSADLLPQVLEPWKALKAEATINEASQTYFIAGVNAQFKEYAELGYPDDDAETRAVLKKELSDGFFDFLRVSPAPLSEKEARNIPLQYLLDQKVDLVWMLDGDETYTPEQIRNIIEYVQKTPQYDYYHVHFDNYVFGDTKWGDDFFPPRIFRTGRSGGIAGFTFDNELEFADGSKLYDRIPGIVPKRVAHVRHDTWRLVDAERKIAYQRKHFGYCMFTMSSPCTVEPDPEYFARHQMPLPKAKDEGIISSRKPALDVVLRSHLGPNVHGGPRVVDTLGGKEELMVRALRSIMYSLNRLDRRNDYTIRLHVLDDHSAPGLVMQFREMLSLAPFETNFVSLSAAGNGPSLRAQYDYARQHADNLIYFVEDDYLHEETALEEMADAYDRFSRNIGRPVGIFPIDYVHLYEADRIAVTRVVAGTRRHWRLITESTCTFMVHKSVLERHWDKFVELTENGVIESTTINAVWRDAVPLFSPIPTLTYHMHWEELMPPFSNWRRLWDRLSV